jgi:hypothetical protein
VDDVIIAFFAQLSIDKVLAEWSSDGTINRVTGDLNVGSMLMNTDSGTYQTVSYELKCKPTQRMF